MKSDRFLKVMRKKETKTSAAVARKEAPELICDSKTYREKEEGLAVEGEEEEAVVTVNCCRLKLKLKLAPFSQFGVYVL